MESFPIHQTIFHVLKKVTVTKAAIERAFSAQKLIHNRMKANLSPERLQDQLFIRYNAKLVLGFRENEFEENLESEILEMEIIEID